MLNRTESVRCRISGQGRTFGRGEPGVRDSYSNGHMSYSYSLGWGDSCSNGHKSRLQPGVRDSYSNGHMLYSYSLGWGDIYSIGH